MKKLLAPLLLVSALLFPSACVNSGAIVVTGLSVELTAIERAADSTVSVSWRLVNPNVASYLVASANSRIYLNGTLVGTTSSSSPFGVPRQGSTAVSGKLALAGPAAEPVLAEAIARGTASYRADSDLVIQVYGDEVSRGRITHAGSVPVIRK